MVYEYKPEVYCENEVEVQIEGDGDVRFSACFTQFYAPVRMANCTVKQLDRSSTYFLGGLEIENCTILCDVSWPWGGHNKRPIRIVDSVFGGFLDVEDGAFEAEVILRNVKFCKGTNLLGNVGTPVEVSFEIPPTFDRVEGQLDVDTYKPASATNAQDE